MRRAKPRPSKDGANEDGHPSIVRAKVAAAIFLVALIIRIVHSHIWQIRNAPFFEVLTGDAAAYDEWARRIAGGEWIGRATFYQAPLYPYFLAVVYWIFGHSLLVVRICQALLGSLACVLLGLTAWTLFSKRAGLVAGMGMALYAPAIFFDGLIQKTVLDVVFMCLALWLMTARAWFTLGLAMGALSLTRENAMVLVAIVFGWAILQHSTRAESRSYRVGAFALGLALVLMPVAIRNYAVGGGFHLTTAQFGPNLFIGNNANADGTYVPLRRGRGTPRFEQQDAIDLAEQAAGRSLSPSEVSAYWTDRAVDFMTSQPTQWLKLVGRKFLLLVNAGEMIDTESQQTHAEWSWPLRIGDRVGHFGVLVPLALLGLIVTWPERRRLWVFYAMGAAYSISVTVFYVFARYRFPLVPLLMLFAAAGLPIAIAFVRVHPGAVGGLVRRHRVAALALTAVTVVSNWPLVSSSAMRAVSETNLAAALQTAGRLEEAVTHYERAIRLQPDYAPAHYNLGLAWSTTRRSDEARAAFERALRIDPSYAEAHNNLGAILQAEGRIEEAAAHYRQAIALSADNANAHTNLAILLADQGRHDAAAEHFRRSLALNQDEPTALVGLAWIYATADAPLRNPAKAVRLAETAVLSKPFDPSAMDTLAAAYAAQGQFDRAVKTAQSALDIAIRDAMPALANAIRARLVSYQRQAASQSRLQP